MSVQMKRCVCTTREQSGLHCCYIRVEGREGEKTGAAGKDRTDITKVKRKSSSRGDEWEIFRQLLH